MKRQYDAQTSTLIRVYESEMLTAQKRQTLLGAPDEAAAQRLLGEWRFFRFAPPDSGDPVSGETAGWLRFAREKLPGGAAVYFGLSFTVHNCKAYLKETLMGQALGGLYLPEPLLPLSLAAFMRENYAGDWRERLQAAMRAARTESLPAIDRILDEYHYNELLRMAADTGDAGIIRLTGTRTDLFCLSVLLQARITNAPPELLPSVRGTLLDPEKLFRLSETEQDAAVAATSYRDLWREPALFDVRADDYLLDICKAAKLQAFGLFPVYAFLFAKLRELRGLRLLLQGKRYGLPQAQIAERMGAVYEL